LLRSIQEYLTEFLSTGVLKTIAGIDSKKAGRLINMKHKVLKVNPKDNVIVALANLSKGETISFEGEEYILQDNINAKHKFFTKDLKCR
jgi:hypothetical protein